MLTNPRTSTEWGTYSFSHAPTTTSGSCPCTPLQALRLSKKNVLTDLYRMRNLPQIWQGVFLYKIRAPNPIFLVHFYDFQKHWPLQSGEPDMSKHLSRIATWKKESHQKYKDPFCRGMMWKNLGLPVSPENPETYKKIFCRDNSCSTFPVFVKSI